MENRKLADLHDAAFSYADARDARLAASAPEVEAKATLLTLMKKHKLEHYKFDNVEIDITHEKEKVTVRIRPQADGTAEPEPKADGKAAAANDDTGFPTLPKKQRRAVEAS